LNGSDTLDKIRYEKQDDLLLRERPWQGLRLKTLIPVATVDYTNVVSTSNPVTAYLRRHDVMQDHPVPFNSAYTLTNTRRPMLADFR
jgi:hypothetical protein